MIRFDDQVVLVTGAGRGLGQVYATQFANRGAQVIVHDAGVSLNGTGHDTSVADTVVDKIRRAGGLAHAAYENLESSEACRALITNVANEFGRLDVLVHNAGIIHYERLEDVSEASLRHVLSVNLEAPLWLSQAVLPIMSRNQYGRIVLTVSGYGLEPEYDVFDLTTYSVSKAAQFGLMNALAGPARAAGAQINAISPVAATRMYRRSVAADELLPEQVAPGVLFLASSRCTFSGVVLRASNGRFSVGQYGWNAGVNFGREPTSPEEITARWADVSAGLETRQENPQK